MMMLKRFCFKIAVTLLFIMLITLNSYAGNLDSPGSPAPTMKTLLDIRNRISSGTVAGTHTLQPSLAPGSTMYTLEDIYNALPDGSTTTVSEANVLSGKTFIKRGGGVMTFSTGTCPSASVPKTGQTPTVPFTAPTGSDGDLEMGVSWPNPRFTDNSDGTVTDNLSGLIWLSSANYINTNYPGFDNDGTAGDGGVFWQTALNFVAGMNAGTYGNCGYTDWRLPNINELSSLVAWRYYSPSLCNTAGTVKWTSGNPFTNVQSSYYWSSTTSASNTNYAWYVLFHNGYVCYYNKTPSTYYVWPVRGGQ